MQLTLIAFSSFAIAFSGALVPGPLFTVTVAQSVKRGFVAGPLIILGHGLLELIMIFILLAGASPFISIPSAQLTIKVLGSLVLFLMGLLVIKDSRKADLSPASATPGRDMHPILYGVVGSVSNPYWVIWWATIGLSYLTLSQKFGLLGIGAFFTGHILADLGWYSVVSLAVAKGKKILGVKSYRLLLFSCGFFLIFFAVWLFLQK